MAVGAPRTVSFSKEEMISLGKEMVEWIINHPDTLHLSEWYTIEKMFTYKQWKTFTDREEFIPYYEVALKIIGRKYLDKDSRVRDGISQRWQRIYFGDLKEAEDQDKDDDVIRQKSVAEAVPEDVKKQTEAMNQQMAQLRRDLLEKGLRLGESKTEGQSSTQEQP